MTPRLAKGPRGEALGPTRTDRCRYCWASFTQPRGNGRPCEYCSPDCAHAGRLRCQRWQRRRAADALKSRPSAPILGV